jgi:uncharacterized protein (DUF58 family)
MLTVPLQHLWQRAPRRLRFTRAGRALVAIAFAVGLAALNTGNNLLFFGWGMVLSAIVLSGVLSEATLRYLQAHPLATGLLRVGEAGSLQVRLCNASRRMPAFALEITAEVRGAAGTQRCRAPYQLRFSPAAQHVVAARFEPKFRGAHVVSGWHATTAYPFGFFEKSRLLCAATQPFWCAPMKVEVAGLAQRLTTQMGEVTAHRAGSGEDFFSLRPLRLGDDWRRIAWRRSARTRRWMVVEHEATAGQAVTLALHLDPLAAAAHREYAISILGSLAEVLLAEGLRVGVLCGNVHLGPDGGAAQCYRILSQLARLDASAETFSQGHRVAAAAEPVVVLMGSGACKPEVASAGTPLEFAGPTR